MKRSLQMGLAACLALLLLTSLGIGAVRMTARAADPAPQPWEHGAGETCPGARFTDLPAYDHWAHRPIDWAVSKGVTSGMDATHFGPNAGCTRAQAMTFLWTVAGRPEAPAGTQLAFTDVKPTDYFEKAVRWAVSKGITAGTTKTTFSPNKQCTRAEIVTFLYKYAGAPVPGGGPDVTPEDMGGDPGNQKPFEDVKPKQYYYRAVLWAVDKGITAGTTPTTFSPDQTCTRAQIVTFLFKYVSLDA